MCGILGFYYKDKNKIFNTSLFKSLLETISYRGPDSSGIYNLKNFIFGMNRLSIIDQESGDQPMSSDDGDYKIIFNGEIYNYKEIRENLESKNVKFKTKSDTEVVLKLFIRYGKKCLDHLNGMFALAIFRVSTNEIFIARDRFGKKPLYYYNDKDIFIFSSELGPIIKSRFKKFTIDIRAVKDYLSLWYVSQPKTIIKDVFQLQPGHFLQIRNGDLSINRWWNIDCEPSSLSFGQAVEKLEFLIEDSVKIRLNSDVKVATMLSGGIGPGIISSYYKKNYSNGESFIIDFKEKTYSEYELAKLSAEKLDLKLNKVDYIDDKNQIIKVLSDIDEPLGNASLIASYQIFNFIKKKKIKVVLTGDGGDELFGGYPTYQSEYYYKIFKSVPMPIFKTLKYFVDFLPVSKNRISFDYKIKKLLKYIKQNPLYSHPRWREPISLNDFPNLFNENKNLQNANYDPFENYNLSYQYADKLDNKNKMMFADFQNYLLNDHLRKIDRSSMLNSVEARCPFLDHRIVNFAFSINSSYKVDFLSLKKILKHIGKKSLDKRVIKSPKKGLTPPINYWIDDYFKEYLNDNLRSKNNYLFSLFNKDNLNEIFDDHFKRKRLLKIYLVNYFLSLWVEKNKNFINF